MLFGALHLQPGGVLTWAIVGLLAGWLAGMITRARSFGCLGNLVIGLVGAAISGFLVSLLDVSGRAGFWGSVAVATLGAVVLLILARFVARPTR